MKKVFTFIAAVAIVASLSSCKKDYTCDCTVTAAGISTTSSSAITAKKSDAESACDAMATTVAGVTKTCELKKK